MKPLLLWACLVLAGVGVGQESSERTKKELEKLQGKWALIQIRSQGQDSEVDPNNRTIRIEGDKLLGPQGNSLGTLKIDAETSPMLVDLVLPAGDGQVRRTLEGIFELHEDTLRFCFNLNLDEKRRPPKLAQGPDDEGTLFVLKRDKSGSG